MGKRILDSEVIKMQTAPVTQEIWAFLRTYQHLLAHIHRLSDLIGCPDIVR